MRQIRKRTVPLLLLLSAALSGCTAKQAEAAILPGTARMPEWAGRALTEFRQTAALVRSESGEIREFFGYRGSTLPSEPVYSVTHERAAKPILNAVPHTELLRSLYNNGNTIVSGVDLILDEQPAETTEPTFGYTAVPIPADRLAETFAAALTDCKLTVTTEERRNPAPAGEVFAVRYAGFSDRDTFYVNPAAPVTLYVSAPKPAVTAEAGDNLVYLTFDDGPTAVDTIRLLDILDEYGVKAAFFAMGSAIQANPAAAQAIAGRGHALGCHTMTHVYKDIYASADALESEVERWEETVESLGIRLPEKGRLFRFPGGSVGTWLTAEDSAEYRTMLEERGYRVYDWNVVVNDAVLYTAPEGESAYDYIRETFLETFEACLKENEGKPGAPIVILMHETVPETIDLMPWMLEYLMNRGCVFGNLTHLGYSYTFADRRK